MYILRKTTTDGTVNIANTVTRNAFLRGSFYYETPPEVYWHALVCLSLCGQIIPTIPKTIQTINFILVGYFLLTKGINCYILSKITPG